MMFRYTEEIGRDGKAYKLAHRIALTDGLFWVDEGQNFPANDDLIDSREDFIQYMIEREVDLDVSKYAKSLARWCSSSIVCVGNDSIYEDEYCPIFSNISFER